MILYRVMCLEEFEAYKAGKTIRARNVIVALDVRNKKALERPG